MESPGLIKFCSVTVQRFCCNGVLLLALSALRRPLRLSVATTYSHTSHIHQIILRWARIQHGLNTGADDKPDVALPVGHSVRKIAINII